jgi:hypothetical protein
MTYYIAMGIGVAVSLAFVFVRSGGNSVRNLIFKSVSSLFFMLSAVFAVIENYTNAAQYGSLIIMGGALGLVGDILLDLKGVYKKDANNYLKGGFIFFLIGHVFYTAAMIHFTKLDWWKVLISAAVAIAVGAVMIATANIMRVHYGKYRRIVFFYVCFLIMTNVTAVFAAFTTGEKSMILMAIGATLFTISDAILSNTYFGRGFDGSIWLFLNHFTYYAGQYLIASSVFFFGK